MKKNNLQEAQNIFLHKYFLIPFSLFLVSITIFFILPDILGGEVFSVNEDEVNTEEEKEIKVSTPPLDKEDYDFRMNQLANNPPPPPPKTITDAEGNITTEEIPLPNYIWPVKNLPYPNDGAILPFNRIIAYYGNLYSRKMGVLGEYDEP